MWVEGWLKLKGKAGRRALRRRRDLAWLGGGRDWILETRCLLASGPPYLLPKPTVDGVHKVLYDGVTDSFAKTITLRNNSPTQTIYPFLEAEVTRQAVSPYTGTGAFDPFDPSNHEYRAYIGYKDGTNEYAGLPPLSTITITVPLAFWDSGRIIISTDGVDQFSTYGGSESGSPPGAPFYYQDVNTQASYFASLDPVDRTRLNFTPAYNSFDPLDGYKPSTKLWKSPITAGIFQNGQTYVVTGPGLPAGGYQVVIDSNNPNFVTLPQSADAQTTVIDTYVFTSLPGQIISPTDTYIEDGFTLTTDGSPATTNGLVMWYHALTSQSPNNDAPFQLAEFTFRGTFYDPKLNPTTGFSYLLGSDFAGIDTDSADYDISFVDTINMPIAMEASNVSIPNTNLQAPFGWVGSGQSLEEFQKALAAFTSDNPAGGGNVNYLGDYFGGKGYPSYLTVDPGNIKLPAGQNLFLASPAIGGTADIKYYKKFTDGSVINEPLYALTSGGTGPVTLTIGGDPIHPSQGNYLGLNTAALANHFALNELIAPNVAKGLKYQVSYAGNFAGNVIGLYRDDQQNIIGVQLDQPVPPNAASQVYSFQLPKFDYAAGTIAGLWYSWAKYYVDHVNATSITNVAGTVNNNILTLSQPTPGLVPGMTVTAAGVPGDRVILSIAPDGLTIKLSEVVGGSPTTFNFERPTFDAIAGFDKQGNTPLVNLTFPSSEQLYALAFAETVYVVMSAWSVSVPAGGSNGWVPLLVNIIGGNLGPNFLPRANTDVVVALTNLSKSALRGVPDFTSPLYSNPAQWYPDPALPAGGQTFNAYNLDPFVWFIHDKLGLSAYAFSLDDDVGNVNGGGANHIDITVGGLTGLPNKDPYTPTSPWGVLTSQVTSTDSLSSVLGGLSNPKLVYQIAQYDYNSKVPGTIVNGPGVQLGTSVQFTQIPPELANARLILSKPLVSSSSGASYSFFGSLVFTGTVLGAGQPADTIILDSLDAYDTLMRAGPLGNLQVTGEGIDLKSALRVKTLTKDPQTGRVTIQLTGNLDRNQVSQPGSFYAYTFGNASTGVIRDPGFEWATVLGLAGNFNHGEQLTQNTVDWIFIDSPTQPKNWFAGIAYNNSSDYTKGNPLAPEGLQVGFVQADSSIRQSVILGKGAYILSLQAAQRAGAQTRQTVKIYVDDTLIGGLEPTDSDYQSFALPFTVTGGQHTITFQGTQTSDSVVLIDAIECRPGSLFTSPNPQQSPANPEFVVQPASQVAGRTLAPVRVAVFDRTGRLWSGLQVRLTVIRLGPLGLRSLVTGRIDFERTVNGVATFDDLKIYLPGRYLLRVDVAGQRVLSKPFIVVARRELAPPRPVTRLTAVGAFRRG